MKVLPIPDRRPGLFMLSWAIRFLASSAVIISASFGTVKAQSPRFQTPTIRSNGLLNEAAARRGKESDTLCIGSSRCWFDGLLSSPISSTLLGCGPV
jgi:hypothetical protein